MNITEICDLLRKELFYNGYEYGFVLKGKKYKPDMSNGFDSEYYRLSMTIYRVQHPSVTMKEKIGTCVETVLVMQTILDAHDIPSKIWLLFNKSKKKVHTILTFEAEGKIVYLELTPQSAKPWYGKEIVYSSEEEFLEEYRENNYEVSDVTKDVIIGEQPEFLLKKIR